MTVDYNLGESGVSVWIARLVLILIVAIFWGENWKKILRHFEKLKLCLF